MSVSQQYKTQGGVWRFPQLTLWFSQLSQYLRGKGPSNYGSSSTAEQVAEGWDGKGKCVVITGASSGLGAESARVLAARGATVVMMIRDQAAGERVKASIVAQNPSADIKIIPCELNSLATVVTAARQFLDMKLPLHILMLNAGVMACPYMLTKDGLETQIGVNHVSHFLLTRLLLPKMIETASQPGAPHGRIVSLSSVGQSFCPPHGLRARAKINSQDGYDQWTAYGQSKLANLLFARELATRLAAAGVSCVDSVAAHPGVIPGTDLMRHSNIPKVLQSAILAVVGRTLKTPQQGAATQVYLATAPTVLPGEYYQDCNLAPSLRQAHDRGIGLKLWDWSEETVAPFVPKDVPPPPKVWTDEPATATTAQQ